MLLHLSIINAGGRILAETDGDDDVELVHDLAYAPGDRIRIETGGAPAQLHLRFDATLGTPLVWLPAGAFEFVIPFGPDRAAHAPAAFAGPRHYLGARLATAGETAMRRDLAVNPLDTAANSTAFPHASATSETRGEALFAARNVIDGLTATSGHGEWPYTSWGINRNPDAALTIDFGRPVLVDEVVLCTRADFPHDAWWERATLSFSEGPDAVMELAKTGTAQRLRFPARRTEWLRLSSLIKADDPSPYPALTSVSCLGVDAART